MADREARAPATQRRPRTFAACLAVTVLAGALAAVALAASTDFTELATSPETVGTGPDHVAAGDFDGDTDQDLAVANFESDSVSILSNDGAGDFTATSLFVGNGPRTVLTLDYDGDADPDLAVANQDPGSVTLLRNHGTGFHETTASPFPVGTNAISMASADFDGDSDPDLALADFAFSGSVVTLLRNQGNGQFKPFASGPEPINPQASWIAAADLDGDADADLAVANEGGNQVTILRNSGDGKFHEAVPSPEPTGGFAPQYVITADVDGDADQDLVVANRNSDSLSILRHVGSGINFKPAPTSPELVGDAPFAIAAADFDGDLDLDLATADGQAQTATVLENGGNGNFSPASTSPETVGNFPRALAAADFDGDLDPDLAVANSGAGNLTILGND